MTASSSFSWLLFSLWITTTILLSCGPTAVSSQSPGDEDTFSLAHQDPHHNNEDDDGSNNAKTKAGNTTFEIFGSSGGGGDSGLEEEETVIPTTTLTTMSDDSLLMGESPQVPFVFTNIYIIGGECDDPETWYSQWAKAGIGTIRNVTKVICATQEDIIDRGWGKYTREFHVAALQQVEEMAGDKLNETLVITVAVGLENDWTPVADLLRKGMAFFHAKEDVHNFNISEFGLEPNNILYFYFQWKEEAVAYSSGKELCRIMDGADIVKVAKIHIAGRNGGLNYRSDIALEAFAKHCPNTQIINLWEGYGDMSPQAIEALLTFKELPDIVLTGSDPTAKYFLEVAETVLSPSDYNLIRTTGWDYLELDLLKKRKILTTVDQVVLYPNRGIWKVIGTVLRLIETGGLRSTKAVQDALLLGDSLVITSDTMLISSDQVGYLHDKLLAGYNSGSPPAKEVLVSTGLNNVTVTKMTPFEGRFEVAQWLQMSWHDPRLEFDPMVYNGKLPTDAAGIWVPALFYQNEVDRKELYTSPAMVAADGTVEMNIHILVSFICPTSDDLDTFPFDSYDCSMDLGAPEMIYLDAAYGFDLEASDTHFYTYTSIDVDQSKTVVHYQLRFERKPFTAYVRLIIPGILINLIGFASFWLPDARESVALAITAFLCSLTFRGTVALPETSDMTWSEVFMMVNIFYQASVLFIIWCSYSINNPVAKAVDKYFKKVHPKKMHKGVKKSTNQVLADISDRTQEIRFSRSFGGLSKSVFKNRSSTNLMDKSQSDFNATKVSESVLVQGDILHVCGEEEGDKGGSLSLTTEKAVESSVDSVEAPMTHCQKRKISFLEVDEDNNEDIEADAERANGSVSIDTNEETQEEEKPAKVVTNVDWIGRWFVVPSYIVVMSTLVFGGRWGFA